MLADLVRADELAEGDAYRIGAMVGADNARRAYGLAAAAGRGGTLAAEVTCSVGFFLTRVSPCPQGPRPP